MFDFFLDLFRGPQDPSCDWQRTPGLQLEFDLDTGKLNTAQLSDDYAALSFLGPSEDRRAASNGEFNYYTLGFIADCDGDWDLAEMRVVFRYQDEPKFRPYAGRILYRGREVELANATEQSFRAQFGESYWRDQDDHETILFYEFPQLEWQVEFDPRGLLNGLIVTDRMLMAKAEQRKAYGVTKPWPPPFS